MAEFVSLSDCLSGLFLFEGSMHLKTEYGEAYVCQSGEFFWGVTTTHLEERADLMVLPLDANTITSLCELLGPKGPSFQLHWPVLRQQRAFEVLPSLDWQDRAFRPAAGLSTDTVDRRRSTNADFSKRRALYPLPEGIGFMAQEDKGSVVRKRTKDLRKIYETSTKEQMT